jgi:hypothetical protein
MSDADRLLKTTQWVWNQKELYRNGFFPHIIIRTMVAMGKHRTANTAIYRSLFRKDTLCLDCQSSFTDLQMVEVYVWWHNSLLNCWEQGAENIWHNETSWWKKWHEELQNWRFLAFTWFSTDADPVSGCWHHVGVSCVADIVKIIIVSICGSTGLLKSSDQPIVWILTETIG